MFVRKVFKCFFIISVGLSFGLLFINYREFNKKTSDLAIIKEELLELNKKYNKVLKKIEKLTLEEEELRLLIDSLTEKSPEELVTILHALVPEFEGMKV